MLFWEACPWHFEVLLDAMDMQGPREDVLVGAFDEAEIEEALRRSMASESAS